MGKEREKAEVYTKEDAIRDIIESSRGLLKDKPVEFGQKNAYVLNDNTMRIYCIADTLPLSNIVSTGLVIDGIELYESGAAKEIPAVVLPRGVGRIHPFFYEDLDETVLISLASDIQSGTETDAGVYLQTRALLSSHNDIRS